MVKFIAIIFSLFIVVTLVNAVSKSLSEAFPDPPEVIAKREAKKAQAEKEMDLILVAKGFVRKVKETMRNPDSFKVDSVYLGIEGAICLSFRSQNGFGGMNGGFGVLSPDYKNAKINNMDGFDLLWNKYCNEKVMKNITSYF